MPQTLTIDASTLSGSGFSSKTYFSDFFAGLTSGDGLFYGGSPDSAFGGTYYMNGSQHVRHYTDGTDPVENAVMLEGEGIAYDFIHHGADKGHGITGSVDTAYFGKWVDGTTTGTEGTGAAGEVQNFSTGVLIDGLGLSAEPGAGTDAETNDVYAFYKNVQDMDADGLDAMFADYSVDMTGTGRNDRLVGYDYDDMLTGRAGADTLIGKSGADILIGGRGNDEARGGKGKDLMRGDVGDDALFGGKGRDTLKGGKGDDTLTGGKGSDSLTGGLGADVFVITKNSQSDEITDFDGSVDMIDVTALGLGQLSDFTIEDGAGETILSSGGVDVHLLGVEQADLADDMFIF